MRGYYLVTVAEPLKNFGVTSSFVVVVRVLVAFAATASRLPWGLFWPDEFRESDSFLNCIDEILCLFLLR